MLFLSCAKENPVFFVTNVDVTSFCRNSMTKSQVKRFEKHISAHDNSNEEPLDKAEAV